MLLIVFLAVIGLAIPQEINSNFALITSEFYPNGQVCHFGTDSMRAIELAAKRNAFTFDVFVSNGNSLSKTEKDKLRSYIDNNRVVAIIEGAGWFM